MKVLIEVWEEDIKKGEIGGAFTCPIALAANRAGLSRPSVGPDSVRYGDVDTRRSVALPENAKKFVRAFDSRCEVQPFAFEIDVPEAQP